VTADSNATNSYFAFFVFSLAWGMCSSLDTNPKQSKNIGFWHTFGTGAHLRDTNLSKAGALPKTFWHSQTGDSAATIEGTPLERMARSELQSGIQNAAL
jgi:hypothetical protein